MDLLDRLLGHDAWTTQQLLHRCRELSAEQLKQPFDMSLGCVHDILVHMISAMHYWADQIGERPERASLSDGVQRTADELVQLHQEVADDLAGVVRGVVDDGRSDEIMSVEWGRTWEFTRGTAIVHVITHSMHHRAQVLNMLRRLGLKDLPEGDAISWEAACATP